MRIYLDDERETPDGFVRTYTVEETIKLIQDSDGEVECVSLDNDLGIGLEEGRKVMDWIEEQAYNNTLAPIPHLIIHTSNPAAENSMMKARHNAWKYWESHGYKIEDFLTRDYKNPGDGGKVVNMDNRSHIYKQILNRKME